MRMHLFRFDDNAENLLKHGVLFRVCANLLNRIGDELMKTQTLRCAASCAALVLHARGKYLKESAAAEGGLGCDVGNGSTIRVDDGSQFVSCSPLEVSSILYLIMASSGRVIFSRVSSKSLASWRAPLISAPEE